MPDVLTMRYMPYEDDNGFESVEEIDALIAVEVSDTESERSIDLHLSPRTDDVVTCSLSPSEAWQLARELARSASEAERS